MWYTLVDSMKMPVFMLKFSATFFICFNKWLKPFKSCFILKTFLQISTLGANTATYEKLADTSIPTVGLLKT